MSSQVLNHLDKPTPSVGESDDTNQNDQTAPLPVPTEDDSMSPEGEQQSWEGFDGDYTGNPNTANAPQESGWYSDSDDDGVYSPDSSEEVNEEDLWSNDEDTKAPPSRPAIPLAPSALQKELFADGGPVKPSAKDDERRHEERHKNIEKHRYGAPNEKGQRPLRPFSGVQGDKEDLVGDINRNSRHEERKSNRRRKNWHPGQSSLSQVVSASEEQQPPSPPSPSDYGLDGDEQPENAADKSDRELEEAAERNRQNIPQHEEDDYLTLDDTPLEYYTAEQSRSTTPGTEPKDPVARPDSPLGGFYKSSDADDAKNYERLEKEFDNLVQEQPDVAHQTPTVPTSDSTNESSTDNNTSPTSPERLEQMTGIAITQGQRRFERLVELAQSRIMQDPQRALEMKRQMLIYLTADKERRASFFGEDAPKMYAKARAAWVSAAAHHYRHQREQARQQHEQARQEHQQARQAGMEWEQYGHNQCSWNEDLQRSYDRLMENLREIELNNAGLEQTADNAREELRAVKDELTQTKQNIAQSAADLARNDIQAEKDAGAARDERLQRLEKQWKRASFFWKKAERAEMYPPKDTGVQTDREVSPTQQAAPSQQTEKSSNNKDAETQTDDQTDSAVSSEEESIVSTTDRGTQTVPETANSGSQGASMASAGDSDARRVAIPLLSLKFTQRQHSALIPEIVRWINESHLYHRGDVVEVAELTTQRVSDLLGNETTFDVFVSALENDGYLFRPNHLALFIERLINENTLGHIPLAILQRIYHISPSSLQQDLRALYTQIAERQLELNQYRNTVDLNRSMAAAPLNSDLEAVQHLQLSLADAQMELQEARGNTLALQQGYNEAAGRTSVVENLNAQARQRINALEGELAESQATLDSVMQEAMRTPSGSEENPEDSHDADDGEADKLKDDLQSYREHGKQLQQRLDEVDGEKEQLLLSLSGCHRHGAELKAANDQLDKDVAYWKAEFKRMEQKFLSVSDELIAYRAKHEDLPELSDDSADDNDEDDQTEPVQSDDQRSNADADHEWATLRADIERLQAANTRLTDENKRLTSRPQPQPKQQQQQQEHFSSNADDGEQVDEVKALQAENARLVDENNRYNRLINATIAHAQETKAAHESKTKSQSLSVATDLPLPLRTTKANPPTSTANLQTPTAIPFPITPAPQTGAAQPQTANSLLLPSALRTPAPPNPPIDAATMPARWLEREKRIQSTNAFWENRRRILGMIEKRDRNWERERELTRDRKRREGLGVVKGLAAVT